MKSENIENENADPSLSAIRDKIFEIVMNPPKRVYQKKNSNNAEVTKESIMSLVVSCKEKK